MTSLGAATQIIGLEIAEPTVPLCAIIIYDNGAAYRRASRLLARLERIAGGRLDRRAIPWRIEELAFTDHRALAAEKAGFANLVIISVMRAIQLPENLRECLEACVPHQLEPAPLVVALLGGPEEVDPPESSRFQFVRQTAEAAGCDFLAPMSFGRERSEYPLEAARA
jgi:hypothetical protein